MGLILLLAGIGIRSGCTFVTTFGASGGVSIFLASALLIHHRDGPAHADHRLQGAQAFPTTCCWACSRGHADPARRARLRHRADRERDSQPRPRWSSRLRR
ncbi:MAG: hypothetical protein R2838_04325 [Caldilineaceae bacterium]